MLKPVPTQLKTCTAAKRWHNGSSPSYDRFFAVKPGLPVLDVMEHASCLLGTALENARDLAMEGDDPAPWAVVYLLESTLALVNASVNGMLEAKQ